MSDSCPGKTTASTPLVSIQAASRTRYSARWASNARTCASVIAPVPVYGVVLRNCGRRSGLRRICAASVYGAFGCSSSHWRQPS